MAAKRNKRVRGLTLIEIMIAVLIVVVAVISAASFRYYCALDAKKADVQVTAGRLAWAILENWRSKGGSDTYDAVNEFASELDISVSSGSPTPEGFTALDDEYLITTDLVNYYATLSYAIQGDNKLLNVCVAWPENYQDGDISNSSLMVKLTTYVNMPSP